MRTHFKILMRCSQRQRDAGDTLTKHWPRLRGKRESEECRGQSGRGRSRGWKRRVAGGSARVNNTKYYVERNTRNAKYATWCRAYALCTCCGVSWWGEGAVGRGASRGVVRRVASASQQKPKNYETRHGTLIKTTIDGRTWAHWGVGVGNC